MVLGASVLLNLAPVLPAADPLAGRDSTDTSVPRPAVERWKRLKSQYEFTPTPANRSPQIDPPAQPAEVEAGSPAVRTAPAESKSYESKSSLPTLPAALESTTTVNTASPVRTAAVPTESRVSPAEFANPFTTAEPEPAGLTAQDILSRPEETSPASVVQDSDVKLNAADEDKKDVSPGRPRPNMSQLQSGPPRKTTQIRRISDIAPLNDFDKNTEIKTYAAEKAREFNVKFGGEAYTPRNFPDTAVPWAAPTTKYYPLYFQDPALERYGHTHHPLLQPVISSARVTTQLVMLPYQMTITPPWELHSPLGWYRPGDVVPKLKYPIPWSAKAAAVEAASLTGLIFLVQ